MAVTAEHPPVPGKFLQRLRGKLASLPPQQKENLRKHGIPAVITAAAIGAAGVGVGINEATDGGVTRVARKIAVSTPLVDDNYTEALNPDSPIRVHLSPFPSTVDNPDTTVRENTIYNKVTPRIAPTTDADGLKIDLQTFYDALGGNRSATLVLGGTYPSGIEDRGLLGDLRRDRVTQQQKAWASTFKEYGIDQTYWSFMKNHQERGVWMRFNLAKPINVGGQEVDQAFISLHQGVPVVPLPEVPHQTQRLNFTPIQSTAPVQEQRQAPRFSIRPGR